MAPAHAGAAVAKLLRDEPHRRQEIHALAVHIADAMGVRSPVSTGRSPIDPPTGGWIGVDLDGTLAEYHGSIGEVGAPIAPMLARVKAWVAEGREVRIFTARASMPDQVLLVEEWLSRNGLPLLRVTDTKDFRMVALYDDRCVQVEFNTGRLIGAPQ